MISKLVTMFFLTGLLSVLWMVWKHPLNLKNEFLLTRTLTVLFSGYMFSVTYIYIHAFQWKRPLVFLSMIIFWMVVGFAVKMFKKHKYNGDLNVFVLVVALNSLGLILLYRLDIDTRWSVTSMLGYDERAPLVLKQEAFSAIALYAMALAVVKGWFEKALQKIEEHQGFIVWGALAFSFLALPKLLGSSLWLMQGRSVQPSEFAFKVIFVVFVAKYFSSKTTELLLSHYSLKEIAKFILFMSFGITAFFFIPLVFFARELGTVLLIGLTFIIWSSFVTRRLSLFFTGIALAAVAMYLGVLLSPHLERRVIGAWLDWQQFAFKPFREGEHLYPGYQIFMALSAIRPSPWGVGIGNGVLVHAAGNRTIIPMAVNDFAAIPLAAEMGILIIFIIGVAYILIIEKAIHSDRLLHFRSILASGIAIAVATQGFYNLSGVFALLPATGIPLPWISSGGSALFANYLLAGALLATLKGKQENLHEK